MRKLQSVNKADLAMQKSHCTSFLTGVRKYTHREMLHHCYEPHDLFGMNFLASIKITLRFLVEYKRQRLFKHLLVHSSNCSGNLLGSSRNSSIRALWSPRSPGVQDKPRCPAVVHHISGPVPVLRQPGGSPSCHSHVWKILQQSRPCC